MQFYGITDVNNMNNNKMVLTNLFSHAGVPKYILALNHYLLLHVSEPFNLFRKPGLALIAINKLASIDIFGVKPSSCHKPIIIISHNARFTTHNSSPASGELVM